MKKKSGRLGRKTVGEYVWGQQEATPGRTHDPKERDAGWRPLAADSDLPPRGRQMDDEVDRGLIHKLKLAVERAEWAEKRVELLERRIAELTGQSVEGESETLRVLVLEDDDDLRHLLEMSLASESTIQEVKAVADADSALALARSFRPDVVVADTLLAGGTAAEIVQELREQQPAPRIISFSGSDAVAPWADHSITKTAGLEALRKAVTSPRQ